MIKSKKNIFWSLSRESYIIVLKSFEVQVGNMPCVAWFLSFHHNLFTVLPFSTLCLHTQHF